MGGTGGLSPQGDAPPSLQRGAGLLFDGATRYTGPLSPLAAPLTIEALLRVDGASPGVIHGLFEQFEYLVNGCRMGLLGYAGNRLHFELSDPAHQKMVGVSSKTPVEIGKWTHLAATYDGTTMRVFVNGKEDGAVAWSGGLARPRGGMTIGYMSGPQYYFVGALAYLRVSDIARPSFPHGENPTGPTAAPIASVTVSYPDVRAHFFPAEKAFPVTCAVTNPSDHEVTTTLRLEATLLEGETVATPPVQVTIPAQGQGQATIPVRLTRRGLYLPVLVMASGGEEVQRRRLPAFAIVEPLPPLREVPAASRFGGQPTAHMPGSELIGMKWNRFWDYPTNWAEMEPERGKFFWEKTDKLVEEALGRGEEILWCLCFTPGWAAALPDRATALADTRLKTWYGDGLAALYDSGKLAWQFPPKDLADWQRYVTAVVQRYGDRVKYWEVWNEANSGHFIGTPQEYFGVLKTAYETIKGLDPKATVVGIAGCPGWMGFTEAVLKLGGLNYMDVLSYHDYAYGVPEVFGCDRKVADTRELMKRYGRVLPMWDTEVGFPQPPRVAGRPMTWEEFQANLRRAAEGKASDPFFARCVISRREPEVDCTYGAIWPTTEDRAARYLVRQFVLEMSEGMEKFNVHAGAPISRGKLPLLPGIAHAMMAKALSTAAFTRRLPAANPSCRLYEFRAPAGPVAVCWTTQPHEQVVLLTRARRLVTADLFGNRGEVKGDGKRLTLPLTDSPMYVFGWPQEARVWNPLQVAAPPSALAGERLTITAQVVNTDSTPLTGELRLTGLPAKWEVAPATANITVPAGKRAAAVFTVAVPADARRGRVTPSVALTTAGASWTVSVPLMVVQPVACPAAPPGARVDGDLGEWTALAAQPLNTAAQVVLGKPSPMFEKVAGTWWGPEDLSGKLWFARGADSLWVAVDVTDDSLTPPQVLPQAYEWDCVELFLDGRAPQEQATSSYGPGVVQVFIAPPDVDGRCAVQFCQGSLQGIEARGRRRAGGYTVEVCVPLSRANFPALDTGPGGLMGLDVALDDADEGAKRKVQIVWQGSADNCRDTTLFGRIRFE